MEARIEALLAQMTLEEKVSLTAGASMWHTTAVERLGIPAIKVTDGPNGARGGYFFGGPSSACFPVGIALASTWNTALVERVGMALGEETKSKGAHVLLGPTVNIHRSPLNGRNFECYSEDPYLSARIAVAYIKGVQSQNVGACIKHYVCNDSEFERQTISSEVRERALREIYLPPFRAAVEEAGVWSVMGAYNKINGVYACENRYTLTEILKGEWGFEGIVISDWFGTKSGVDSANNGLDLEMPGPAQWMGEKLLQAVREGLVSEAVIDDKVRRLLRVVFKSGAMDDPEARPEAAVDRPEHRKLIREAAAEGIVLLKNARGVLPLDPQRVRKLAVIGPNAKAARVQGGGSARVTPHYTVTPFEGITSRAGDAMQIAYALGCTNHKLLPLIDNAALSPVGDDGARGFQVVFFNNLELSGAPVARATHPQSAILWAGKLPAAVDKAAFSARMSGRFTAGETGAHAFSLISIGPSRLYLDGEMVIDNWTDWSPGGDAYFGMSNPERIYAVEMQAGQSYEIVMEYCKPQPTPFSGVRLGHLPPVPADSIARAAALAAESDVALLFVGTSDEWETEGHDRPDMELPGQQAELIEAVAAANPNTVVVLNTGSPISMPWLDQVAGVVQAWFAGQETGNAIADVLFGDVNPSGRLPQTFPKRLEDNPAYINYPGENGQVHYGEGIFVGYRYYDKKKIDPLFPFGFGLSYTTFSYSNLTLSAAEVEPGEAITVAVDVTNTGDRAGKEVAQLYVRDLAARLSRPEKELKAFAKVMLAPGETHTVTFTLDESALSYYDPAQGGWVAEAGAFEVLVGSSSRHIQATGMFTLKATSISRRGAAPRLSTASTLQELLSHEGAKAVLEKHFGGLLNAPQLSMAMGLSLEQIASFAPDMLTTDVLQAINEELANL